MRMEREHGAVLQFRRAVLDPADRGVAVFDREGELTTHVRRAHALDFGRRHASGKYQPLGSPADRPVQRTHPHVTGARRRDGFRADFRLAGCHIPQRLRSLGHGLVLVWGCGGLGLDLDWTWVGLALDSRPTPWLYPGPALVQHERHHRG